MFGTFSSEGAVAGEGLLERFRVGGRVLLLACGEGELFAFGEGGRVGGEGVDVVLQFVVVDEVVAEEGVEAGPVLEAAVDAFDLGEEGLFDEAAEDSNQPFLIVHYPVIELIHTS
jgi:hypothetical protein